MANTYAIKLAIQEALILLSKGSWSSLADLRQQVGDSDNSLATSLLHTLCVSPLKSSEQGEDSIQSLAKHDSRSACGVALGRTLMSLVQLYILNGEYESAKVLLRQSVASSVCAVLTSGIQLPTGLIDQLLSHIDELIETLSCQLSFELEIKGHSIPDRLILILGTCHHDTSLASQLLAQSSMVEFLCQKKGRLTNITEMLMPLSDMLLGDHFISILTKNWYSRTAITSLVWSGYKDIARAWQAQLVQQLQSRFSDGNLVFVNATGKSMLLPMFNPLLESGLIGCSFLLVVCHPARMVSYLSKESNMSFRQALSLWLNDVLCSEYYSRSYHRVVAEINIDMLSSIQHSDEQETATPVQYHAYSTPDTVDFISEHTNIAQDQQSLEIDDILPIWVIDEKLHDWYDLALLTYSLLIDTSLSRRKRESRLNKVWQQWLVIAPSF